VTPEELLVEIHRKQGFLVLGSNVLCEIGSVVPGANCTLGPARLPLRITQAASPEEFMAQDRLAAVISGRVWETYDWRRIYRAFYRVDAAD
jgi:hypothetical protein